jgi:hypothetical protein
VGFLSGSDPIEGQVREMSALYPFGLHHRWDEDYTPVSKQLLEHLIEVLCGHVARWEW